MKIEEAKKLTLDILNSYSDLHYNVYFYNPTKSILKKYKIEHCTIGFCTDRKIIALNKIYILALNKQTVKNVVKHEIAHAIDYTINHNSDHGTTWKNIAKGIGLNNPAKDTSLSLIENLKLFYYFVQFIINK